MAPFQGNALYTAGIGGESSPLVPDENQDDYFNSKFQQCCDVLRTDLLWETDQSTILQSAHVMIEIASDFLFAVKTYGKIIISESVLPDERKTIKPMAAGGRIGGEKYIHRGLFFKFVRNVFLHLFFIAK